MKTGTVFRWSSTLRLNNSDKMITVTIARADSDLLCHGLFLSHNQIILKEGVVIGSSFDSHSP